MFDHLFQSRNRSRLSKVEDALEDQLDALRSELASLASTVRQRVPVEARHISREASHGFDSLVSSGEDLYRMLRRVYRNNGAPMTRDVSRTVRRHPLAAVGTVAAAAVLVTWLVRR